MFSSKQLVFLKRLSLAYIYLRLVADFSLFIPSARNLAIGWGWPLNDLWLGTAISSIVVMLILVIMDWHKDTFDGKTTLVLFIISASWSYTLLTLGVRYEIPTMQYDGLSWLLFCLATINYAATKEEKEIRE